ncbi:Frag1/DRAM/Sfk1, partial [Gaertneriomyces semiglobifer]
NQFTMAKHRLGLGYGWFPMIAGTVWLVMVAWLLILWLKDGSPQYKQDDADVVYISDVGSIHLRIFRIGSCITAGFFILSLLTEFILRSRDRLPAFRQYRETLDSICALVFGTLASICLILLTFYNADRHKKTHWGLTLGFMICLSISCLFTAGEYQRLRRDHFQKRGLRRSFILKVTVIVLSICLAIAMIVLMYTCRNYWSATEPTGHCNRVHSASAICEWVIALLFGIYLFTLVMDLRPS